MAKIQFKHTCSLCGNTTTFIRGKKMLGGYLCKDCKRLMPYGINFRKTEYSDMKDLLLENKRLRDIFNYTGIYGNLYIDSMNNIFCYSERFNKKGDPLDFGQIHHVSELTGVGMYCTNLKNIGKYGADKIVCDVVFKIKTKKLEEQYVIKKATECKHYYEGRKVEWNEPGDFLVFRKLFEDMLDNWCTGLADKVERMLKLQELGNSGEDWAKGILFIGKDETITPELLKKRRNQMMKLFHPDNGNGDAEISSMVNEAYKSLS